MAQAALGLDMLRLTEIPNDLPGVLGFLMAREDGPPTVVRRPPLDCYLLGIGLNIAKIRVDANGRSLRCGTYGLHGVHLTQPNQDAAYYFTGKLVNFRLRLSMDAVAAALEQMDRPSAGVELADIPEQFDQSLGTLCTRLLRESLSAFPDQLRIDTLMQTLVDRVVILNTTRPMDRKRDERLSPASARRVMRHISQSYMRPLTLAELSAAAGYSRSHFLRGFRNVIGAPPHAFLMMYRLHKAGEQLRRTALSLAEIATANGFFSHGHMTAAFRQWTGFTPSEFREPARHGFPDTIELLTP